jgi:Viral coat protein P2 N-terminal domain
MIKRRIPLPDISAIGLGKTAVVNCPIGPRYHGIYLTLIDDALAAGAAPSLGTDVAPALFNEIRVKLAGREQRRHTAQQLDAINNEMSNGASFGSLAYTGTAAGTGRRVLPIFFGEPWRQNRLQRDALAWQTGHLGATGTLQIEVDIASAGFTGSPNLQAFAVVDDFIGGRPHAIMKWFLTQVSTSGTSVEVSQLARRDLYAQISIFRNNNATPTLINRAKLVAGGTILHDLNAVQNAELLKGSDMNPTTLAAAAGEATALYNIVFDHTDDLDDLVPMTVSDLQLSLTLATGGAGIMPIVTQRLGLPE